MQGDAKLRLLNTAVQKVLLWRTPTWPASAMRVGQITEVQRAIGASHRLVMVLSEAQAIGYDLSKIKGYDPNVIIDAPGWVIIKHILGSLMDPLDQLPRPRTIGPMDQWKVGEFRSMALQSRVGAFAKNQMKALAAACEGNPY